MGPLKPHSHATAAFSVTCVLWGSFFGAPALSQGLSPSTAQAFAHSTSVVHERLESSEPDPERCRRLETALAADPQDLQLMAELMRALANLANLGDLDEEERKATYARGTEIAQQAMKLIHGDRVLKWKLRDELTQQAGRSPWGGVLHYWAAMTWGGWGEVHGAFPALRAGVADRLRLHGHLALELAPDYDWAGPYRFLGRMHAVAPKVPLFTGWIDRTVGQRYLEQAYARAPEHPQNQLFLAESWLDQDAERQSEQAEILLRNLAESQARPGHETFDRKTIEDARAAAKALATSQGRQ